MAIEDAENENFTETKKSNMMDSVLEQYKSQSKQAKFAEDDGLNQQTPQMPQVNISND